MTANNLEHVCYQCGTSWEKNTRTKCPSCGCELFGLLSRKVPMTKDKLRQIAEWVELIAYNEMSDPSSKFLVEAFEEICRLREREGDLECMLEKEQNEHDETRGYRQHAEQQLAESRNDVKLALEVAERYGQIDGDHHKTWVIDQMVRQLTEDYDSWVARYMDGEDGPETYDWDTGISP